jgi:hypothetical protein
LGVVPNTGFLPSRQGEAETTSAEAPDEEFDKAIAAARGAIQAFEAARSAYVEGWRANPVHQ